MAVYGMLEIVVLIPTNWRCVHHVAPRVRVHSFLSSSIVMIWYGMYTPYNLLSVSHRNRK